jgi:phage baseplate assembly protein W
MLDNPHFAFPFRIQGGRANTREQDSPDQIMDAAIAVVGTPPHTRTDTPGFGCPDQAFNPSRKAVLAALDKWEPRAAYAVTVNPDLYEPMMVRIRILLKGGSDA